MEFKQQIEQRLQDFLQGRDDLFLVDLKISAASDVTVILDGDNGVTVQDCLDASRAIEFTMDREVHDFSLQIMSAGLSEPLGIPRQYKKNIGRNLQILTQEDETIEGELIHADNTQIKIQYKYRKPKEIGKGKMDVVKERELLYTQIKKAKVAIQF